MDLYTPVPIKVYKWDGLQGNRMNPLFWLLLLLATPCAGEIYMIVEYDTNGTARSTGDIKFHTVELQVTVLGCDHGYYAETVQPLECRECVCSEFVDGRNETFV